jgi:hypothetical protein
MLKVNAMSPNRPLFIKIQNKLLTCKEYHDATPSRRLEMFKEELEKFDYKETQIF